jgi:hypothetical protein
MNPFLLMAAKEKLELEDQCKVYKSQWAQDEDQELQKLFEQLYHILSSKQAKELVSELDDQSCRWTAAIGESKFIQGFQEGYKMAKQHEVSNFGNAVNI